MHDPNAGPRAETLASELAKENALLEARGQEVRTKERTLPSTDPVKKQHKDSAGFKIINLVKDILDSSFEITATQAAVLTALSLFSDSKGIAHPKQSTLARRTRLSERGQRKAIRQLEAKGILRVVTHGSRGQANTYNLQLENIRQISAGYRHSKHSPQ